MSSGSGVTIALVGLLLAASAGCTPLIVARSGNHFIVATNSTDSAGGSRCKLHFAKSAVVLRATQAASMVLTWPDGHTESVDFDDALNRRLKDLDAPIDTLKEVLLQDVEERIRALLQLYRPASADRVDIAGDVASEYVIVGRERNGFLGVRAFTLEVEDPQRIAFEVRDLSAKLRDGEVVDFTGGESTAFEAHGAKAVRAAVYARLEEHKEDAARLGNQAFSPPYLVLDVTHGDRSFLSDPGPCRL